MHAKSLQSSPTLCDPMDCVTCQVPLSMGSSRQEYWSGLSFPPPGDLPNPGIEPALQTELLRPGHYIQTLYCWASGEALSNDLPQINSWKPNLSFHALPRFRRNRSLSSLSHLKRLGNHFPSTNDEALVAGCGGGAEPMTEGIASPTPGSCHCPCPDSHSCSWQRGQQGWREEPDIAPCHIFWETLFFMARSQTPLSDSRWSE